MQPVLSSHGVDVFNMDARQLARLECDPFDAIVTDPPYELGLGTAGRVHQWDSTGVAFDPAFWRMLLDVVKPGAYLMAFGAPRTWHRLACAVEDAGWTLTDQIAWLYASGMPKGEWGDHAVDRALGVKDDRPSVETSGVLERRRLSQGGYEPKTGEAAQWRGYNPMLKPAWEPILVARAPRNGTLGSCLLDHGTGALHVMAGRLDADMGLLESRYAKNLNHAGSRGGDVYRPGSPRPHAPRLDGRYPSNVAADETAARLIDAPTPFHYTAKAGSGERPSWTGPVTGPLRRDDAWRAACTRLGLDPDARDYPLDMLDDGARRLCAAPRRMHVAHPTVKPLSLMRWLVRLAVPTGGCLLDPFAGSGTTLQAAVMEGFTAVGVERDPIYLPLIRLRLDQPIIQPLV